MMINTISFQDTTFLNRKEILKVVDRFLQLEPSLKKGLFLKLYFHFDVLRKVNNNNGIVAIYKTEVGTGFLGRAKLDISKVVS